MSAAAHPTFPPQAGLRAAIEERVDAYFERTGLPRQGGARMYAKTAFFLAWLVLSYVGLVFLAASAWQAALLAVSLGVAMAGVGFNVQHDGGHGGYSPRRGVNRAMAKTLDLVGCSSYFWSFKHNIAHHTYTNVSGADEDIYMGPLARLSPHDRRLPFHRFQHLYIWFLYMLLVIKWQLVDDFRVLATRSVLSTHVPRPRGAELATFWVAKAVFVAVAFGIPLLLHPLGHVLAAYALVGATSGLLVATVFQLAHCVEEAEFHAPDPGTHTLPHEWAAHQIETTVDFARDSRPLTWFLGGLNFQVEHHLFPRVSHVHYPALSPIVEQACIEHGVRHRSHATMRSAIRSHYRWVRRLGRKPGPPMPAPLRAV